MKLTSSGLFNAAGQNCVDENGNAKSATSLIADSTRFIIKSANINNRTSTGLPFIHMIIDNNGLHLTQNFKLNYTIVMRTHFYFRIELMFMTTNSVDSHTFIISLKASNMLEHLQSEYNPPSGKWFSGLNFYNPNTNTSYGFTFSTLNINTVYSVDKSFTQLQISASQNLTNLEATHCAETTLWPRII